MNAIGTWLSRKRWRLLDWALLAVAVAMTGWVASKAANYWWPAENENSQQAMLQRLIAKNSGEAGESNDAAGESAESDHVQGKSRDKPNRRRGGPSGGGDIEDKAVRQMVEAVDDAPLFGPPEPTGFQGRLTGTIGDQAIFNGRQLTSVGDAYRGAEVLEVGPDWVRIKFEGEEKQLWTFGQRQLADSEADDRPGDDGDPAARQRPQRGPRPSAASGSTDTAQRESGSGSPHVSKRLIRHLNQLSPEQRRQAMEKLPDEVADQVRQGSK